MSMTSTMIIIQSIGYILGGFSAMISSFVVIITVLLNKSLYTKDFYMLAGLSGADLFRGYGYCHSGILRIWLVFQRTETVLITPKDCIMQIFQTFMLLGQTAAPWMVMMLSLDRFLAVVIFHRYRHLGTLFALGVVGFAYTLSGFVTSLAWIATFFYLPADLKVFKTCTISSITPHEYFCAEIGLRFFPGIVSALFYAAAILAVRSKAKGMQEIDHKRQTRLTKNVAVIVLVEFLFSTLPYSYMWFNMVSGNKESSLFQTMSSFVWSMSLFGAAGNLFLYAFKYPKFRKALFRKRQVAPSTMVAVNRQNFRTTSTTRY